MTEQRTGQHAESHTDPPADPLPPEADPPPERHEHRHRYREFRARFKRNRVADLTYRSVVTVLGTIVLVGGLVMIPYPGPGWLVVFAGLAILATEYTWAERVLGFAKGKYDAWEAWLKRQNAFVRWGVLALTGLIVLVTLWLLGAFGLVGGWVGIEWSWIQSPIPAFS